MKQTTEGGPLSRALFLALIGRHLKSPYHVVRHRLGYLDAVGDVLRGELTADEIVDAVLLRAYRDFVKEPLTGVERARALRRSELETRRILEQARAYLRQTLVESGYRFKAA